MGTPSVPEGPRSLTAVTVRRAFANGKFFLVYGTAMCLLLGVALGFSGGSAFVSSFPLFLPIFGVVGSMGGLVVFTNDRLKGVLEYLMAYGVTPRRIFLDTLVACFVLVAIVVGIGGSVSLGVYLARGQPATLSLALGLGGYAVPMSLASVAFAATVGMFWTSLSSPRSGMNSPIGLIPFIGILPSLVTVAGVVLLALAGYSSTTTFAQLDAAVVLAVTATVVLLIGRMDRLLRRERLLSPA
jgi:hypothetical protein